MTKTGNFGKPRPMGGSERREKDGGTEGGTDIAISDKRVSQKAHAFKNQQTTILGRPAAIQRGGGMWNENGVKKSGGGATIHFGSMQQGTATEKKENMPCTSKKKKKKRSVGIN